MLSVSASLAIHIYLYVQRSFVYVLHVKSVKASVSPPNL